MVDYADIDDFRNKLSLFRRRVIICEVLFLMLGLLFFVSAYLTSGKGPYPGDLLAILTVCSLFGSLIWYFIMSYLVSKWTAEMFGNRCPFCGKKLCP